jgi:hypothetical protein
MKLSIAALLLLGLTLPAVGAPVSKAPVAQSAVARSVAPAAVDSEASLEYLIGLAGKLSSEDNKAHLDQLKAQLEALLSQKEALIARLADARHRASGADVAGDPAKAQALLVTIQGIEASLAKLDVQAQLLLREIQKIHDDEQRRQDEAKRGAETLRKFAAVLTESPPHDTFVKKLSPAAREAALAKARSGQGALTAVARVALVVAENANSAAMDAARKQGQLIREQDRLRSEQRKLEEIGLPTPTPTRTMRKVLASPK